MSEDRNSKLLPPSRRKLLGTAAAVGGAATLGAFLPSVLRAADDTVRIGVLAPLQTASGKDNLHGVEIAAEEINAAGGILGRKVEVVPGDSEGNPEKGIQVFQTLATRDKVQGIIGGFRSGVILALHPYIARYKIPFIVTGAASPSVLQPVVDDYERYKYLFRAANNSDRIAEDMSDVCNDILQLAGIKKYAIDAENYKWAQDYASRLKDRLRSYGLEVTYETTHDPAITDFTPIFKDAVGSGAEAMCVIVSNAAGYTLVKQWRDQRVPLQLVDDNYGSFLLDSFWKDTQGACEYEIANACRAPLTEKSIDTWKKFEIKYGESPYITALGSYDSVFLFKLAMEMNRSTDADAVVDGLEKVDHVGAIGRIVFGKDHEALHDLDHIVTPWGQWRDGKKEALWPAKFSTAKYAPPPWMA